MAAFLANPRAIDEERVKGQEAAEKNIWSSLLENVGSGKKLPEKNILVLGPC